MDPEQELALVLKALTRAIEGVSNCVEWFNDRTVLRVLGDPANQGLEPTYIRRLLLDHVRAHPDAVEQRREHRGYPRDFWYRVVVPVDGFRYGLFVEIILSDEDPDYPCVKLVNAHP